MAARELFVWYRVRRERADEARAAVLAMQRSLAQRAGPACRRASSLATTARRRPGWKPIRCRRRALATTAGIDVAIEAAIAAAALPLEALIDGPRHVEAFAVVA